MTGLCKIETSLMRVHLEERQRVEQGNWVFISSEFLAGHQGPQTGTWLVVEQTRRAGDMLGAQVSLTTGSKIFGSLSKVLTLFSLHQVRSSSESRQKS